MFFHYAVFILLVSPHVSKAVDEQYVIPHQLAVASNIATITPHEIDDDVLSRNQSSNSTISGAKVVNVHYENSNGFVPIMIDDKRSKNQRIGKQLMAHDKPPEEIVEKESESYSVNDSLHSSYAEILLNPQLSVASRDPSDQINRRSDFEILKVSGGTPEVANYQEFYDNIRSATNEDFDLVDREKKKKSNRSRRFQYQTDTKNIGSTVNTEYPYYNRNLIVETANPNDSHQFESDYDLEKVNNDNHEQHMIGSNFQRNVALKEKPTLSNMSFNLNQSSTNEMKLMRSRKIHQLKTPSVENSIISPISDHRMGNEFGNQSVRSNPLFLDYSNDSTELQYSETPIVNINFNKSDNQLTDRQYDHFGDLSTFSDESLDYSEITEKLKRFQEGIQETQISGSSSAQLSKEHREIINNQENNSRKRQNFPRFRQRHRQRYKSRTWNESGRYPTQESDTENGALGNSHVLTDNVNSRNIDLHQSDSWNHAATDRHSSHSNSYESIQIEKPKILPSVNVNLVPSPQFNHQIALGSSQEFDFTNAMIQNHDPVMSPTSTSIPLVITPLQNLVFKQLSQNSNFNKVPDIIVGQTSLPDPVGVISSQGQMGGNTQSIHSTLAPPYRFSQNDLTANTIGSKNLYVSTPTMAPSIQPVTVNPVLTHTLANILQGNTDSNIQIQNHGFQGQNSLQIENVQPVLTTVNPVDWRYPLTGMRGNYLASASLAVGNGGIYSHNQNQGVRQNFQNLFPADRLRDTSNIQRSTDEAFLNSMRNLQLLIQKNQRFHPEDQRSDIIGSRNINQINTVFRTPYPVLSTTGSFATPVSSTPDNLQINNYVNSLTEFGSKVPPSDTFNPSNYASDTSLPKTQFTSNQPRPIQNGIAQQSFSFLSLILGGDHLRNGIQSSNQINHVEELLRKFLRAILYNQQWNNDMKLLDNSSVVNNLHMERLKNELLQLKNKGFDFESLRSFLEAQQSDNMFRVNARPPYSDLRKPPLTMEQTQQMLRDDIYSHLNYDSEISDVRINEYLTPPKPNSYSSNSLFHDKPAKQRPKHPHPLGFPRNRPRNFGPNSRPHALEVSTSSNHDHDHKYPRLRNKFALERDVEESRNKFKGSNSRYRERNPGFDAHPMFTTSSPEYDRRMSNRESFNVNYRNFHNPFKPLMKDPRKPLGISRIFTDSKGSFRKTPMNEKQRFEYSSYGDGLSGFRKKSDPFFTRPRPNYPSERG